MRFSKIILVFLFVFFSNNCLGKNNGIERTGDIVQLALPIGAGLYSLYKKDTEGLKELAYSSIVTTGIVYALKYTVKERRPNGGCLSFPSGHTAISFSSSTYMWKRYGKNFGVPTTLLAGFVGYSRIQAKKHFFHDVLAGAAIGAATSYFFTTKYKDTIEVTPETVSVKFKL